MKNNFVAIDFETAQSPWKSQINICQIGIVVVENGEIIERISRFVKPPGNKYDKGAFAIHGITPQMTKNEPTFDIVWRDIEKYFINTVLVAHNAYAFDEKVLWQNLDYYNIKPQGINKFIDTIYLYGGNLSIDSLCSAFDIECNNRHDALSDAVSCAQIYLKFLQNETPNFSLLPSKKVKKEEREKKTVSYFKAKHATDENLLNKVQILSNDEFDSILSHNLFEGKRVINTGTLSCIDRNALKSKIIDVGGRYVPKVNKLTNIVILGKDPGKLETIIEMQQESKDIICITEQHLEKFLKLTQ